MLVRHKTEAHKVHEEEENGLAMIIVYLVDYIYIETVAGSSPLVLKLPHSLI